MVAFDNIESIFQNIRGLNEYSQALVTLSTAIGAIVVILFTLKATYDAIQCLRLYLFSQFCCRANLKTRYGQWAVISGSTDGIGLAMARELARQGMSIVVIGRNEQKLANTKQSLEAEPNVGDIVTVKIDLSDSSMENFESIRNQIDPDNRDIGILINNAGTFPAKFQRYNKFDMSFILNIVNLNILSTLHLTRMVMPGMVNRGRGLVLNVSSILGCISAPYMSVYGPTKSFINAFSRQLQIEYSSHPIDIINLTTGGVHTKLFQNTANMPSPTPLNPSAEDYARSAISAVSTGINQFSGTLTHGLCCRVAVFGEKLGLLPPVFKLNLKLNAKDYELSPVPKRKKSSAIVNAGGDNTN